MAESATGKPTIQAESVWDYPRPPRLEPTTRHLRIIHAGQIIAETHRALRILETSHPPTYYFPPEDVTLNLLEPSRRNSSFCEFKGHATYWNLIPPSPATSILDVAWCYPNPSKTYQPLRNYLAFYASKLDECWVDGERASAQPGDFYGGWITSHVKGPFKGPPGTLRW